MLGGAFDTEDTRSGVECERWKGTGGSTAVAIVKVRPLISWPNRCCLASDPWRGRLGGLGNPPTSSHKSIFPCQITRPPLSGRQSATYPALAGKSMQRSRPSAQSGAVEVYRLSKMTCCFGPHQRRLSRVREFLFP